MGIRITHIPTGLSRECREFRSQAQNRKTAFLRLSRDLVERVQVQVHGPDHGNNRAEEVVRTYNEARNAVVDHRTKVSGCYREVLYGKGLDKLIQG